MYRDPVQNVSQEILYDLELTSDKIHPLPGSIGRKLNDEDIRVASSAKTGDDTCFYEHIATVKQKRSNIYYVAFRETMDAFLARQPDIKKYPIWLMNNKQKQTERNIYIYQVYKHPSQVAVMRSHEDWLRDITDPKVFNAVAYFLSKHNIIDDKILATLI